MVLSVDRSALREIAARACTEGFTQQSMPAVPNWNAGGLRMAKPIHAIGTPLAGQFIAIFFSGPLIAIKPRR
ncbi:hypothetical protein WKR88_12345 [Trinickia caryophylli]|uniref:hypothetical protein n=1 Tax=Trinickia caryophylli TaxID=28094 RepID=UPI000A1539BF|nr:hypothetical protein [Trinickia caryophylli]PMS08957.1 hypothetical protein C0Z17_27430 [Trinickia caryophylli]TRX17508.1 hypothetical protein FNF07_04180 [Trinickia caryophylli]WQE11744.1 hypothetical protein U0034_18725 [Trinickia caryophylli]